MTEKEIPRSAQGLKLHLDGLQLVPVQLQVREMLLQGLNVQALGAGGLGGGLGAGGWGVGLKVQGDLGTFVGG